MSNSDVFSPESSLDTSLSTPDSHSSTENLLGLVIRKEPPAHVFADKWFEVEVGLDIPKEVGSSPTRAFDIELVATLHDITTGALYQDANALLIEPAIIQLSTSNSNLLLGSNGDTIKVKCKIDGSNLRSATDENTQRPTALAIRFASSKSSPKNSGSPPDAKLIQPVMTTCITVVKYFLEISSSNSWENVWYKDEGGRDKCITATVSLYNKDHKLEQGRTIPLQLTLFYESQDGPVLVSKQEILRSLGSSKQIVDKKSGISTLRFRIEDVSKNHQGQDFTVQISVDKQLYPINDVAPVYTPAISIRSKRNKRQRISSNGPTLSKPDEVQVEESRLPSSFITPMHTHHNIMYTGDDRSASTAVSLPASDIPKLKEAIKGVITWTEEVVNGLRPLQWQIIGYAQDPDGSPDYNRPYYNMQNPNACISRLLSMYTDDAWENIRILQTAIEKTKPSEGNQSTSPYGPHGISMPTPVVERTYGTTEKSHSIHHTMDQRMNMPSSYGTPPTPAAMIGMYPANMTTDSFSRGDKTVEVDYTPAQGVQVGQMSNASRSSQALPPLYPHQQQSYQKQHPQQQQMGKYGASRPTGGIGGMGMQAQEVALPPHLRQSKIGMQPDHQRLHPLSLQDTRMQQQHQSHGGESREAEVEYVLAKQFKSMRTGERLGFPAYSSTKELVGFYRESSMGVGVGQFVTISLLRDDFGHVEMIQATQVLEDEISKKSEAVHTLKDWGSISSLIDHALVYDWSKDMGGNVNSAYMERDSSDSHPKIGI